MPQMGKWSKSGQNADHLPHPLYDQPKAELPTNSFRSRPYGRSLKKLKRLLTFFNRADP